MSEYDKRKDDLLYDYETFGIANGSKKTSEPEPDDEPPRQKEKTGGGKRGGQSNLSPAKMRRLRKKKIRRRIILTLFAVVVIAVILLIVSLFLKVSEIKVVGNTGPYTDAQIIAASGIGEGDKILYLNAAKAEKNTETSLPYVCNVKVKKQLFSTVIIETERCAETYCYSTEEGWAVTNENNKVLSVSRNKYSDGLTEIVGVKCENVVEGKTIKFTQDERVSILNVILSDFKCESVKNISRIDLSDKMNVKVVCNSGELEVMFGSPATIDYKLKFASEVINKIYATHDEVNGTLDLSVTKKAYYSPVSSEDTEEVTN